MKREKKFKKPWPVFIAGILFCAVLFLAGNKVINYTSTDEYCVSCHVHTYADNSWKQSIHYYNASGVRTHCVECHLPPKESINYLYEKGRTGLKDLYSFYFKDRASFDWESRRTLEYAVKITYNESCLKCHQTIFTKGLSEEAGTAHLYYEANAEKLNLQCINCHQFIGHYNPNYVHGQMTGMPVIETKEKEVFKSATELKSFENFTEQIPNSSISFNMIAIPGGSFKMGSPDNELLRKEDEGPVRDVTISPFFMAETEVSWDEYWTFFGATMAEGRIDPSEVIRHNEDQPDAISGPTPPFGIPDQGWGSGKRPAITMTHYAASIYCQWLSQVTGKKYRLPTEAEWEYACRAGSETPFFFDADLKKLSKLKPGKKISSSDTARINSYIVFNLNSPNRTQEPSFVQPNPFGLKNLAGNVMEFCSDWYSADAYSQTPLQVKNPTGPESGEEHVVRGGSYASDVSSLRAAARDYTKTADWLKTDPQQPKSIWWYADIKGIGFRVVCEADSSLFTE